MNLNITILYTKKNWVFCETFFIELVLFLFVLLISKLKKLILRFKRPTLRLERPIPIL